MIFKGRNVMDRLVNIVECFRADGLFHLPGPQQLGIRCLPVQS